MARFEILQDADGAYFLSETDDGEHEGLDAALMEIRDIAPDQDEYELIEADGYRTIWT